MLRKMMIYLLLLFSLFAVPAIAEENTMEVLFWNAGKADAFLIRTDDSTVLIDTGKNKFGKELVSWMQQNGITDIDMLIITHFDKDHVGGADRVLEAITVGQVLQPAYVSDSKQYQQYVEAMQLFGITPTVVSENTAFELDGVSYEIDVANRSFYGDDEENDFSLVIGVRYGETSFLFAGDAENPRLMELLSEGIGRYDVLKVPHHGRSETLSAAFFDAVQPSFSVITSDEEETEDAIVVRLLQQYGDVYLTREGTVTCVSDGRTIQMQQQKGGSINE